MGDDKPAQPMTGWQKRDAVESTLKSGDAVTAQSILKTVEDQKLFMTLLASKAQDDSSLHGLQITNGADGTPNEIKTDKMVISLDHAANGDAINAHGVGVRSQIAEKWNQGVEKLHAAGRSIAAPFSELGDALGKAGTSQSLTNQRINRQIDQAEGNPPGTTTADK